MKNRLIILVAALLISSSIFGQRFGSISGSVKDKLSGEPIPFASVSLLQNKNILVTGTVSDDEGKFSIEKLAFREDYRLIVSFIGYETDTIGVKLNKDRPLLELGNINISTSEVQLEAVEVRAMSKTVNSKIDRRTYMAKDFEAAKGGTASDLLNKLPSVSVDPDGQVSVRGTSDFIVYLNGKPTQMDPSMMLGQISSDAITSIDVITVPGAKYDAQGKGGIINITTKTNGSEGISVSANGTLGGAPWANLRDKYSGFEQNDARYGGGLNLMYGKEDLTLYGGMNYNHKNVNGQRTGDARIFNANNGSYKHMVAAGERPEWYTYYSANAGMDYSISDASQLSINYFFGNRQEGRSAFYIYNNFYADANKDEISGIPLLEEWVYNPNTDNRYGLFHNLDLSYVHKFGNKSEIRASFLYEHSSLNRELDNYNYVYDRETDEAGEVMLHYNQTDETPLDAYRFSLDYSKEFENGNALDLGVQPQLFHIQGGFGFDTLGIDSDINAAYSGLQNAIDLQRGIYAGYVNYTGAADKLEYMVGLRLEYTDQEMEIENPDYFTIFDRATEPRYFVEKLDWFPTLHASYMASETGSINFAANRRISRPPIKNMAPFLYRRHLEVYVVGDPALKPEYSTNVELGFEQKLGKQKVNLNGFYRGVNNEIFRVNTIYTEEMVLIRSYTNSGNSQAIGAELNANLQAGKSLKFYLGGSLYNYHIAGDIFGYQENNNSLNWNLKGNVNLIINPQLKFTTDFDMKSATVTAQGQNAMFYMANAALNYSPASLKNLNLSVRVLDYLVSNVKGLDTRAYNSEGVQIFYQETVYTRNGPIVEFGASYAFNKNSSSEKKRMTIGDSEF